MNALPFVLWDRLVDRADGLHVYGWIDRNDGRSDFVVLSFHGDGPPEYVTSSAMKSSEIATALRPYGHPVMNCQRVVDVIPGVTRTVSSQAGNLSRALPG
jgi:hypothetical protein